MSVDDVWAQVFLCQACQVISDENVQPSCTVLKQVNFLSIQKNTFYLKSTFRAPAKFGQPTEWTHPHIIGRGEVNHGILKEEFHKRRERLVDQLLRFNFSASTNYLNNLKHQIRPSQKRASHPQLRPKASARPSLCQEAVYDR